MCYDKAFIDFSKFQSALILGKVDNNDLYANGVGKTAIFKAIEYVLFNYSEFKLEEIIRDDTSVCSVTIDLLFGKDIFRITRVRTKKGTTDLSLFKDSTCI
jgi:predicted ATP-binding protein involved in virulence